MSWPHDHKCLQCRRDIVDRRRNKCLYCGAEIPPELLFSAQARQAMEAHRSEEEQREKERKRRQRWLKNVEANYNQPQGG